MRYMNQSSHHMSLGTLITINLASGIYGRIRRIIGMGIY